MFCQSCGQEISDSAVICIHCGASVYPKKQQNEKPILGFILSFFLPLVGLIVSSVEYKKAKKSGGEPTYAFAGIIIGIVLTVISLFVLIFSIIFTLEILDFIKENMDKLDKCVYNLLF